MRRRKRLLWGALTLSGMLLIGCARVSSIPSPTVGAPAPTSSLSIPTPPEGKATIVGVLQREGSSEPVSEVDLYLTTLIRTEEGKEILAALDTASDPRAFSDEEGVFLFTEISPETYGLAIVCPTGSFLLREPDTGEALLTIAEAGAVIDLGTLYVPQDICR